jgi:hypothetical protein
MFAMGLSSSSSPWQKYRKIARGDQERGSVTMVFSAGRQRHKAE